MLAEQPVQKYKAIISYDGTDFLGFQIQARGRTVQGVVEQTLNKLAQQPVRIIGAGRTDTGVHATGQVIAFQLPWRHSITDLQRALNATLPPDIAVNQLNPAEANFHPRFSALSRQYQYTIINRPIKDVITRRYAAWIAQPLNLHKMQQASQIFLGTRNFASFGKPPKGNNSVRTIIQADWRTANDKLIFNITANAFLYRMVRNIVGTLIEVGLGKLDPQDVTRLLLAQDRTQTPAPAPPNGLCLVKVNY